MGSVRFSCDDIHFNRMGAVKLRQETTPNGIRIDSCDISLVPSIAAPNACRIRWSPDPEHIYKFRATIDGDSNVLIAPNWGNMPIINENDISGPNPNPGFFVEGGITKFTHPYTTQGSSFCMSNFSTSLDLGVVFLDFENNSGVPNPPSTCSESSSVVFSESNVIEKGVLGDGVYDSATFSSLDPNIFGSQLNYIRIVESITYTATSSWFNGRMRLTLNLLYNSRMTDSQLISVGNPVGNTISANYQPPNQVGHTYQKSITHAYTGVTLQDSEYQDATGPISQELLPGAYSNNSACVASLTRDRRVGQPNLIPVNCNDEGFLPHFGGVAGIWSR